MTGTALASQHDQPVEVVETAATAMAASAKALIEAAFVVALRNPRNMEQVRQRLLAECDRPGFAEAAHYLKPIGNEKIPGLSIRFAEAAYRFMGNLDCQQTVTFDDAERRIVKVTCRDLETNAHLSIDVLIEKSVERRYPDQSREKLGERKNKQGQTVYILSATEDEVFVKQNAMLSKARRNLILAFLPGDVAEECESRVFETLKERDKKDPKGALRVITDNFFRLGIDAAQLTKVLGHDPETISPAELELLRALYNAVKQGEATWADIVQAMEQRDADPKGAKGVTGLRDRLGLEVEKKADAQKAPPQPPAGGGKVA